eukprot:c10395_g1_i2.p1 GENE.c10395_g1_i2~~c10395_g1_i2.p1  ORF type:complete len:850 (+),score=221.38 c10395_g1_i2:35-2551(+)
MNSTKTYLKQSQLESKANTNILFMMAIQLAISLSCAFVYSVIVSHDRFWYLDLSSYVSPGTAGVYGFFTWLILLNTLIPISLYVSIEVVKMAQAIFLGWDLNMYSTEYMCSAQARTSNLNEELGQVQYIFSDKTGTLTRNQMDFLRCSIGGVIYGNAPASQSTSESEHGSFSVRDAGEPSATPMQQQFSDPNFAQTLASEGNQTERVREFLLACALCHTVVRTKDSTEDDPQYQGASPDEIALVRFASSQGYSFVDRDPQSMTVRITPDLRSPRNFVRLKYQLLHVIEFDSTRKRMSVVLRHPETQQLILYCKGADSAILERVREAEPTDSITQHLSEFAMSGLRTLCLAQSQLVEEEYQKWRQLWLMAELSPDKDHHVAIATQAIETDLSLVGVSAIEDKLQEGVPETIEALIKANINIWMLTGDKEETAINIAYSCRLLDHSTLTHLTTATIPSSHDAQRVLTDLVSRNNIEGPPLEQLVIDGKVLEWCLSDHRELLLKIAPIARAVIVCRATPLQKAEIVSIVKLGLNKITLAVGDGANDVPMIQGAHIGIGIAGQEGCQAVRSSDYSIGQFRFLQYLLFVHGRWFYNRIAVLFLYSFYKNLAFTLCHVWLGLRSLLSGQSYYNDIVISVFNMFFSAFPILVVGVYDRDLSPATILKHPQLYKASQQNETFNLTQFWGWIMWGSIQSVPIFIIPMWMLNMYPLGDGHGGGLWAASTTSTLIAVLVTNIKIILEANLFNWLHLASLVFGLVAFFFVSFTYELYLQRSEPTNPIVGLLEVLLSQPMFWAIVLFTTTVTLLPDFLFRASQDLFYPTLETKLRYLERYNHQQSSACSDT